MKYSKEKLLLFSHYTDPYVDCYYDSYYKQWLYRVKSTDQWFVPNSEGGLMAVEMED